MLPTSYVNINLADKRRRYGQILMINHNNTSKSFPLLISHIIVSNHQSNLYCFRHAICSNLTKAFTYSKTGQDKFAEISTKIVIVLFLVELPLLRLYNSIFILGLTT